MFETHKRRIAIPDLEFYEGRKEEDLSMPF